MTRQFRYIALVPSLIGKTDQIGIITAASRREAAQLAVIRFSLRDTTPLWESRARATNPHNERPPAGAEVESFLPYFSSEGQPLNLWSWSEAGAVLQARALAAEGDA